jgi:hypothetical protein
MFTPMWDVSLGLFFNFLAMSVIGMGPSLYFLSGKNSGSTALGIAPAVGFVITSLIGTYLTLLDWPISRSSWLILIAGTTLSLALALAAKISAAGPWLTVNRLTVNRREILPVAGAFVILSALAMAPQLVGGLRYSILRGNGSDSFNYITVAGYLDHEPYSWAFHADVRSLAERHPSYERAHQFLKGRWTTPMMLAFTSRIGGAAPYKFEYFFSVLCLLLAFGPVCLFCRHLLSLRLLPSTLTAVAVCGGSWAQLILDLRADSQLNSIPVLLLLVFLVARMEMDGGRGVWRSEIVLVAASTASLSLFYPEILPTAVLGTGLFLGVRLWQKEASLQTVARLSLAACLALIAVSPTWRLLLAFAARQLEFAAAFKNNWDQSYYSWLYSSPLTGVWGFGPFTASSEWLRDPFVILAAVLRVPFVILGAVLTAVLLAALVQALYRGNGTRTGAVLAATFTMSVLIQWAWLCARGQRWAGGKALSFGYPFLMISVAAYAFQAGGAATGGWRRNWGKLARAGVYGMLLVHCGLAVCRPILAWPGLDYPNYIVTHGEYKHHDWNVAPFAAVLEAHKGSMVWSDLANPWLADYIGFVFGWDVRVINIGTSRDIMDFNIPQPSLETPPEYLFLENNRGSAFYGAKQVAQNTELSLLKIDGLTLPILDIDNDIDNPNGLEGGANAPSFWLGTKPATLTVLSPAGGGSLLCGRFTIGPSKPALRAVDLTITSDTGWGPEHLRVAAGQQQFAVHTKLGLNHFTIQVENAAIRFPPSDPRPLLLRVDELHFQPEAHGPGGSLSR